MHSVELHEVDFLLRSLLCAVHVGKVGRCARRHEEWQRGGDVSILWGVLPLDVHIEVGRDLSLALSEPTAHVEMEEPPNVAEEREGGVLITCAVSTF